MIDAVLHIANMPALVAAIAAADPDRVTGGVITGFASTPAVRAGVAALVYVRMTEQEASQWRGTPGVTILAEAPYGPESADAVYAALFADPTALAVYDSVYDRTPQLIVDELGATDTWTPPPWFGVLA